MSTSTYGKVALVTGSSRGIGRAIAKRLGDDGARVVVNYRADEESAARVVEEIESAGSSALAVRADVADPASLRGLFDATEARFGGIDLVVNNVATARFAPLRDTTDEDFETMLATNVRSGFVALREAARRVRDGGRIVVVSAGVTLTNAPTTGIYAAGKAAVEQLAKVLAKELGPRGITVNNVLPGATRTDALARGVSTDVVERAVANTPLGRLGEPDDIADIVAFLASDEARWITGQSVAAGGGAF